LKMAKTNWREILGWGEEQINELRLSGFSFLREGKYDKALLFFQTLMIIDPKSAYDAQTLGALYLQIGKKEEALRTLNQALEIDPSHEPSQLNKAKALLSLDRREEALTLALYLQSSRDPHIAGDASALLDAYT
jgi:tetratricopeptide (TPR) repeat protein